MSCCSNQRGAATRPALRAVAAIAGSATADTPTIMLRYTGREALTLRGPFSGTVYRIGTARRSIEVDARDIEAMLRTGIFAR